MIFRGRFISFIFFIGLLLSLGCSVINKGENSGIVNKTEHKGEEMLVERLDAIILTSNDLPTMREGIGTPSHRIVGYADDPPVADGYAQFWGEPRSEERIRVHYWSFQSVADARAAAEWRNLIMLPLYQPESNASDVIGDATWRYPNRALIWFVKSNVLVHITGNQLALTRSVARKIVTKIEAALPQE